MGTRLIPSQPILINIARPDIHKIPIGITLFEYYYTSASETGSDDHYIILDRIPHALHQEMVVKKYFSLMPGCQTAKQWRSLHARPLYPNCRIL